MSEGIAAALIGLAGGLIGSVVTYIATMRATKHQLAASRDQSEREHRNQIVLFMADFLTEYTADEAQRNPNLLRELDHQLERLVKTLHMQGKGDIAMVVSSEGRKYLESVEDYATGRLSPDRLGDVRLQTRNRITEVINNHAEGAALVL